MSTPPVDRRTLAAIAPKLAELTETVLFGDIWARSELSPRERSLITLSALTAQAKLNSCRGTSRSAIRMA